MLLRNVHHIGREPSRTCITKPVMNEHLGKWCATFECWRGEPGKEVRVGKITSAPLFLSQELAAEAANRAMDVLEKTGMFPNMCEVF